MTIEQSDASAQLEVDRDRAFFLLLMVALTWAIATVIGAPLLSGYMRGVNAWFESVQLHTSSAAVFVAVGIIAFRFALPLRQLPVGMTALLAGAITAVVGIVMGIVSPVLENRTITAIAAIVVAAGIIVPVRLRAPSETSSRGHEVVARRLYAAYLFAAAPLLFELLLFFHGLTYAFRDPTDNWSWFAFVVLNIFALPAAQLMLSIAWNLAWPERKTARGQQAFAVTIACQAMLVVLFVGFVLHWTVREDGGLWILLLGFLTTPLGFLARRRLLPEGEQDASRRGHLTAALALTLLPAAVFAYFTLTRITSWISTGTSPLQRMWKTLMMVTDQLPWLLLLAGAAASLLWAGREAKSARLAGVLMAPWLLLLLMSFATVVPSLYALLCASMFVAGMFTARAIAAAPITQSATPAAASA